MKYNFLNTLYKMHVYVIYVYMYNSIVHWYETNYKCFELKIYKKRRQRYMNTFYQ